MINGKTERSAMSKIKITVITIAIIIGNNSSADAKTPIWVKEVSIAPISGFTNAILNHYYTIARLNNAIELLKTIPKKLIAYLPFDQLPEFTHPRITRCINEIRKNSNFQQLFDDWHIIATYKSADDAQYIDQYSSLICHLITLIKDETTCFRTKNCIPYIDPKKHSCEIAFRFFLVHRLQNTYRVLQQCKKLSMLTYKKADHDILRKDITFTNPHICSCITKTSLDGNLNPTIYLFDLLKNYQYIEDPVFIKEFLYIIFITLRTIKQRTLAETPHPTKVIAAIINNYQKILEKLSIERILDAIDAQTKRISATLNLGHL